VLAIHLYLGFYQRRDDRILSTRTSPVDVRVPQRAVVKQRRDLHIIRVIIVIILKISRIIVRAMSSLIRGIEAPRVCLAIGCNCKTVVTSRSGSGSLYA